jgi:phosphoadenosine phosphosulfate reductase
MVKKQLANGEACRKCVQAEELLKRRGLWGHVEEVVWAVEGDPSSAGHLLGRQYGLDQAPFFLVHADGAQPQAYANVLQLVRDHFDSAPTCEAPAIDVSAVGGLAVEYAERAPQDILHWALDRFGAGCALAFSGAEDVVLIDMAARTGLPFSVFTLDTGRLHAETYRFIEDVRARYGISIELVSPDHNELEPFVRTKGLFSFYEDGHQECCRIRKVAPLERTLERFCAWATGQRRDQSPTRADVPVFQVDASFAGKQGPLLKVNPLAQWSSEQVWSYIRDNDVPYNPLHDQGFLSIGCAPCTRAVKPGQHERDGRWWWEQALDRECGLHNTNAPPAPRAAE